MLTDDEIRQHLADGVAGAFDDDTARLGAAENWLTGLDAEALVQVDRVSRRRWWVESSLGPARSWSTGVLHTSPVTAALAGMHTDGYVRERAVDTLAAFDGPLADRALALRLTDHVAVIRGAARRAILRRTGPDSAGRIMGVLELIRHRHHADEARSAYLQELVRVHGETVVWSWLRTSTERTLRRVAFRTSLDNGLFDTEQAVAALLTETDQLIRSALGRFIAETAPADVVAGILLERGTADGRALGLVRLSATQIDPGTLERLLLDSAVLVRLWARKRWAELGREALPTYWSLARDSDLRPRLRARAYSGVLESGGTIDRDEALELLRGNSSPLVRVGLTRLVGIAVAEDREELFGILRSGTNKEARLASDCLLRLRRFWVIDDLSSLKLSEDAELRRRAWRLHRELGGWEATLADLAVLGDPDEELATRGRTATPPLDGQADDEQRQRIQTFLPLLDPARARILAFAAGMPEALPEPVSPAPPAPVVIIPPTVDPAIPRTGRLHRWFRRQEEP